MRARYDSAQTTGDNSRHWAWADGLSPNSAVSDGVRRTLRNRARYEVANNSYAKGIVLTLANDTIGTGPKLQLGTDSRKVNSQVEWAFADWADSVDLAGKLRLLRSGRAESGEVFLALSTNPRIDGPVKLDLRLLEPDQVSDPYIGADSRSIDGIVVDEYGNPTSYYVYKNHPGEVLNPVTVGLLDYDRVPASAIIHYFRPDRPGQMRGIPDITPALPLFAQLRRYTLAVIAAAETAADFAAFIQTNAPPNGEAQDASPFETLDIEKRMLMTLPSGWSVGQLKSEQPTTTYGEFKREILNEIARCLNMPFNVAAGNSSSYNYASGRLDHQTYFKAIRVDRTDIERSVLRRIFSAWFSEAVLVSGLLPQEVRSRSFRPAIAWFWDGFEHVDPVKETTAMQGRLDSYTTTLSDECARLGKDWELVLEQRARELARARELGLPATSATTAPAIDPVEEVP